MWNIKTKTKLKIKQNQKPKFIDTENRLVVANSGG